MGVINPLLFSLVYLYVLCMSKYVCIGNLVWNWLFLYTLLVNNEDFTIYFGKYNLWSLCINLTITTPVHLSRITCILMGVIVNKMNLWVNTAFPWSQVRTVDEMNYDFQALALESRGMGEVRAFTVCVYV